jgi:phosphate starvation-inducible PhoH-like protein
MIVTGDVTQVDLPADVPSGLVDAMERLCGVRGIATVGLQADDIVRHRLVQNIVSAYGRNGQHDVNPVAREKE